MMDPIYLKGRIYRQMCIVVIGDKAEYATTMEAQGSDLRNKDPHVVCPEPRSNRELGTTVSQYAKRS